MRMMLALLVVVLSILAWCKTHMLLKLASQCTLVIKPAGICNFTQFVFRVLKLIASQLDSHFNDQLSWCDPQLLFKFPFKLSQRQPTLCSKIVDGYIFCEVILYVLKHFEQPLVRQAYLLRCFVIFDGSHDTHHLVVRREEGDLVGYVPIRYSLRIGEKFN
mgnify:CR=1 FL=1